MMSIWDMYPPNYRSEEVQAILQAVKAGECVSVIGLSGAGKSNLLGYIARRVRSGPKFSLLDCNNLPTQDMPGLFKALVETLGVISTEDTSLTGVTRAVETALNANSAGLCILMDRFDLFNKPSDANKITASNLRYLRDRHKYSLTYVVATRKPLETDTELAELFSGNTIWLGPLNQEDSFWSIGQYAARKGVHWDNDTIFQIYTISKGYPSLLRAVCEAYSTGIPLDERAMNDSPVVQRRVTEFWNDQPDESLIQQSRLDDHPLFFAKAPVHLDVANLTTAEHHLLEYFIAHTNQICEKDDLIQAVWPDEKVTAGMRDDSLSQLVHRLREKLGVSGKEHIQTIPRRGYRYNKNLTNS